VATKIHELVEKNCFDESITECNNTSIKFGDGY